MATDQRLLHRISGSSSKEADLFQPQQDLPTVQVTSQRKSSSLARRTMKKLQNKGFREELEARFEVKLRLPDSDAALTVEIEGTPQNVASANTHLVALAEEDILHLLLQPASDNSLDACDKNNLNLKAQPAVLSPTARDFSATSSLHPQAQAQAQGPAVEAKLTMHDAITGDGRQQPHAGYATLEPAIENNGEAVVLVDNSNLFYGAHLTNTGFDPTVKVDVGAVVDLIEKHFSRVGNRYVAGGQSLKNASVRSRYKAKHYYVAYDKEASNGKERFVDDILLSLLLQEIFRREEEHAPPGAIVIVTGDGNDNTHRATFVGSLRSALRRQWVVHQWCWRRSRSERYTALEREFPKAFQTHFLDDFREHITFVGRQPVPLPDVRPVEGGNHAVLIDNCHLYVGAQQISLATRDRSIRVNVERLLTVVLQHSAQREQDGDARKQSHLVFAGSLHATIEKRFKAAGFQVEKCDPTRAPLCVAEQVAAFSATARDASIVVLAGTESSVVHALENAVERNSITVHHYTWSQASTPLDSNPKYVRHSLADLRDWLTFTR